MTRRTTFSQFKTSKTPRIQKSQLYVAEVGPTPTVVVTPPHDHPHRQQQHYQGRRRSRRARLLSWAKRLRRNKTQATVAVVEDAMMQTANRFQAEHLPASTVTNTESTKSIQKQEYEGEDSKQGVSVTTTATTTIATHPSTPTTTPPSSKVLQEFHSIMSTFQSFSSHEITSIPNPRYRALYQGVAAGASIPAVLRGFEILYQDFLPIRVAGRKMNQYLRKVMEESLEERRLQEERLVRFMEEIAAGGEQGLMDGREEKVETVRVAKKVFGILDGNEGHGQVSMQQFSLVMEESMLECTSKEIVQDFVHALHNPNSNGVPGEIDFEAFFEALVNTCTQHATPIQPILEALHDHLSTNITHQTTTYTQDTQHKPTRAEKKRQQIEHQYDTMVASFRDWEKDLFPDNTHHHQHHNAANGGGRLHEVFCGCFQGAKSEQVVNALRIVYTDYAPLKLGGDLIFTLMQQLVVRKRKQQQ